MPPRLADLYPDLPPSLGNLPTTVDAAAVAGLVGLSEWKVYEAARNDELPEGLRPIRIGRRLVWPTVPVLVTLGLLTGSGRESAVASDVARDLATPTSVCLVSDGPTRSAS